jgi:NADH:ubiquinone oxidoreductase subunit 6 (subunit J)
MALSTEQKVESLAIGGCFGLAAAAFTANCVVETDLSFFGMYYFGLLLLPLAVMFRMPAGRPRRLMALAVFAIASMGLPIFSLIFLRSASPLGDAKHSLKYFKYFIDGAILSSWIPAFLSLRPR